MSSIHPAVCCIRCESAWHYSHTPTPHCIIRCDDALKPDTPHPRRSAQDSAPTLHRCRRCCWCRCSLLSGLGAGHHHRQGGNGLRLLLLRAAATGLVGGAPALLAAAHPGLGLGGVGGSGGLLALGVVQGVHGHLAGGGGAMHVQRFMTLCECFWQRA